MHLLSDVALSSFPLLSDRSVKRKAYVVVAADRGLAGAFNTNLLKKAESEINKFGKDKNRFFCIGKNLGITLQKGIITWWIVSLTFGRRWNLTQQ